MKKIITAIAIATVLSTPVFAADNNQTSNGMNMQNKNMSHGMMMGMDHEQMMKMQLHMEEMKKMMASIKQEKDSKKREAMMEQGMKEMEKHMDMMQMMNKKPESSAEQNKTSDEHDH